MEFFIPGVLLFLMAIIVAYAISPHLTPIIVLILSIVFLTFGVYTHYQIFASEYRLSTWQDGLKNYAPAVMIIAIILFLLFAIVGLFSGIKVPIPAMPEMPTTNSLATSVTSAYNSALDTVSDATSSVAQSFTSAVNDVQKNVQKNVPANPFTGINSAFPTSTVNSSKNKVTPSYLETI